MKRRMNRIIHIQSKREIKITEVNNEYYAIQTRGSGDCGQWHTTWQFETKEEAIEKLEEEARKHLEKNQSFVGHRLVFIKELEEAHEKNIQRGRW